MESKFTSRQRSQIMASIPKKNTKAELAVRRYLHRIGFRYSLHARDLPGSPDIVFRPRRAVVFVHGCFWHRCPHCSAGQKNVRTNTGYWLPKFDRNRKRDSQAEAALISAGWLPIIIWECQVDTPTVLRRVATTLRHRTIKSRQF